MHLVVAAAVVRLAVDVDTLVRRWVPMIRSLHRGLFHRRPRLSTEELRRENLTRWYAWTQGPDYDPGVAFPTL